MFTAKLREGRECSHARPAPQGQRLLMSPQWVHVRVCEPPQMRLISQSPRGVEGGCDPGRGWGGFPPRKTGARCLLSPQEETCEVLCPTQSLWFIWRMDLDAVAVAGYGLQRSEPPGLPAGLPASLLLWFPVTWKACPSV